MARRHFQIRSFAFFYADLKVECGRFAGRLFDRLADEIGNSHLACPDRDSHSDGGEKREGAEERTTQQHNLANCPDPGRLEGNSMQMSTPPWYYERSSTAP